MSHRQIRELVSELEPKTGRAGEDPEAPERSGRNAAYGCAPTRGAPSCVVDRALHRRWRTPGSEPVPDAGTRSAPGPGELRLLRRGRPVEPLAPARFKVQFTAGAELRDKLERLQALMRSSVPDGDLAKVIDLAVTKELERLEARRFAKTKKPRKRLAQTDMRPKSRRIPAPVRRVVEKRDGGRCTYRDKHGRRCSKRHDLEFHHRETVRPRRVTTARRGWP